MFDAQAIADPDTSSATFEGLLDDAGQAAAAAGHARALRPGLRVQDRDRDRGARQRARSRPRPRSRSSRPPRRRACVVDGFRIRDGHHPHDRGHGARPRRRDRGQLQHLVRPRRARDGRRAARRRGGRARVRGADPVRPPDGRQPGDLAATAARPAGSCDDAELASASFGQGQTFVTPLQMALVAATVANDGVLMTPHVVHGAHGRRPGRAHDRPRGLAARAERRGRARRSRRRCRRRSRATSAASSRPARRSRASRPPASPARRSWAASGEPHSWFIGFAPVENPKVAIAVLVERGGRGGERAAPLAGDLMARYFELYGNALSGREALRSAR